MHLADTFIQSDLQCIQAIHILSVSVKKIVKSKSMWNEYVKINNIYKLIGEKYTDGLLLPMRF